MSTVAFSLHKLNQLFKSKGRIEIRPPAIDVYVHIIRFTDILRIQELAETGHHFLALTTSLAILIRSPASNGPSLVVLCNSVSQIKMIAFQHTLGTNGPNNRWFHHRSDSDEQRSLHLTQLFLPLHRAIAARVVFLPNH